MADLALGVVGAVVGSFFGQAWTGFQVGYALGSMLFPPEGPDVEQGRLGEIRIGAAQQGAPIPIVYGRARVPGNYIWLSEVREESDTTQVGGKGGQSITEYSYFADIAVSICRGPISSVRRIWANGEVIYDNRSGIPAYAEWLSEDDLYIFDGSEDQMPWSVMADALPEGECNANRGLAFIGIANLPMTQFSNTSPQFSFEIETADGVTVEDVLLDVFGQLGVDPEYCDFSEVAGRQVRGLVIAQRTEARSILEWLQGAYMFDIVEVDGLILAKPWGAEPTVTLLEDDLGIEGDVDHVSIKRKQDADLPRAIELRYYSEATDFQGTNQFAQLDGAYTEDVPVVEFPIVLTEDEAKRLAIVHLLKAHVGRLELMTNALPKMIEHAPADVVRIPTNIGLVTAKFMASGIAEQGFITLAGVEDDPTIYVQTATGAIPHYNIGGGIITGDAEYFIRGDLPALKESHCMSPRVYAWGNRPTDSWDGAKVDQDPEEDAGDLADWGPDIILRSSSIIGQTLTDLEAHAADSWDTVNHVDVELVKGELTSCTEAEAYNLKNLCIIGSEVLVFRTATLIGPKQYRLSNLIRGVRGSEWAILDPAPAGSQFVLWANQDNTAVETSFPLPANHVYSTHYRIVPLSGAAGLRSTLNVTDGPMRAFAPAHLQIVNDGGDRVISWTRRARKNADYIGSGDVPLDYDVERYALFIGPAGTDRTSHNGFVFDDDPLLLLGVGDDGAPDLSTALATDSYTVDAATWAGFGGGDLMIAVCQIGVIGALGYVGFGRSAIVQGGS